MKDSSFSMRRRRVFESYIYIAIQRVISHRYLKCRQAPEPEFPVFLCPASGVWKFFKEILQVI